MLSVSLEDAERLNIVSDSKTVGLLGINFDDKPGTIVESI